MIAVLQGAAFSLSIASANRKPAELLADMETNAHE